MRLRRLTTGEAALAVEMFGDQLNISRLRLLAGVPTGGWAMVIWRLMLFPVACDDFSSDAIHRQAWFVHELTHAWQFQHRPMATLITWARVAMSGGYLTGAAYRYAVPFEWDRLNLEQQAKAVEHTFLLKRGVRAVDMPEGATLSAYQDVLRASP